MVAEQNLLFIVIDQFRADMVSGPLADRVPLPNIQRLVAQSLSFQNHHTVTVPCGPARTSLLTGQYAMSHGARQNGAPLRDRTPNIATSLREVGRELLLFGYTDTQPDPYGMLPLDPAHLSYTGPIPGVTVVQEMRDEAWAWLAYTDVDQWPWHCAGTGRPRDAIHRLDPHASKPFRRAGVLADAGARPA